MSQESLRVTSCRHYPPDFVFPFPKCGAKTYDPNAYPGGGFDRGLDPAGLLLGHRDRRPSAVRDQRA